jgi:glycosyltransferase involved in cell wall biosynthesis
MHIRKIKGWLYIPRASKIVIFHQDLFIQLYKKGRIRKNSDIIVYYTHTVDPDFNLGYLREANKIVVMSKQASKYLETNYNISRNKIEVLYGGVDTKQFFAQPRLNEKIAIFVCDYKARKRPDLILRTVEDNKDWHFILHGLNWNDTEELNRLKLHDNFSYFNFNFQKSRELYSRANVFISLSDIEGGPLPAIEALICGKKVILTNTGFAEDLALLSGDVHIVQVDPSPSSVTNALKRIINESTSEDLKINYKELFDYEVFLRKILNLKTDRGK